MASHFVVVELLDPTVNSFLWKVRQILGGRRYQTAIHLTIRGPYKEQTKEALHIAYGLLAHDVLRIAGIGRFSNRGDEVLYFGVHSPNLREAWYKPDYPIERFGFTPHVSVYRGPDRKFADAVEQFLKTQHIELLCAEHRVVWHTSQQPSLLSLRVPSVGDMTDMDTSNRVDVTVLDRLQEVVDAYRQEQRGIKRRLG